jgi:peptide/nickel transport system substrate-binding protein
VFRSARSPRPIRLGAVAAAAAAVLTLAACAGGSGSQPTGKAATNVLSTTAGQYGRLPAAEGKPTRGGTISYGIINGETPNWILPITPDADFDTINSNFQTVMWPALYSNEVSNRPRISYPVSIGNAPKYSSGDKTVTVTLKHGYTWADGNPVDAQDVAFFIDVMRAAVHESAANFGSYTPGDFPDNVVSFTTPSKYTIVFHLDKAYNPSWFTETQLAIITPLPSTAWAKTSAGGQQVDYTNPANAKAIYNYLKAQAGQLSTYATNKLWQDVDGPFVLSSFTPSTGENVQTANPHYTGPHKPYLHAIHAEYFASSTAEFNQLRAGTLNIGGVSSSDLPQVPNIERNGYHVWGYPDLGFA